MSSLHLNQLKSAVGFLAVIFIILWFSDIEKFVFESWERVFPLLLALVLTLPLLTLRRYFETRNNSWGDHLWKLSILGPITAAPFLLQATNCGHCFSFLQTIEECFKVKFGGKSIEFYLASELAFRLAITARSTRGGNDEWAMRIHHLLTIILLSGGIFFGFHGVSILILVTHNISDIFLDACQVTRLRNSSQLMQAFTFIGLLISWILTRNVFYPMIIWYTFTAATYDFYGTSFINTPGEYQILAIALLCLQLLHIFWTGALLRIAANFYKKAQLQEK